LIFAAPAAAQLAAVPRAAGLPEPSIIVGLIEASAPVSFERVPEAADVGSNEITYDNLAARTSLRRQDISLFSSLVDSGAFDPPPELLARALQTELARMGCYTAGIDGNWGRGSVGAVDRYFAQRSEDSPVTRNAEVALFRQIISFEDVACPPPEVAVSVPRTPRSTQTPNRTRETAAPQPRNVSPRAADTTPAPKTPPKPAAPLTQRPVFGTFR
jgi:hypothetical protein